MADKIVDMLYDSVDAGYTPSEIKESVVKLLGPFFNNTEMLVQHACSSEILSVYEFMIRYYYDPAFLLGVSDALNCYNAAYKIAPDDTLKVILSTLKDFSQKENLMWTIRNQTPNNPPEDYYDAVIAYMDHIGATLEIGTKHIFYELYVLIKLIQGKKSDYDKIQEYDFGVILSNILAQGYFDKMLRTSPISIKLSDWRNIAYHHSYSLEHEEIICTYGKKRNSFKINLEQLKQYTHQIIRASNIFNIARCIFVFDKFDKIQCYKEIEQEPIIFRRPLLIQNLKVSLASQGFELHDYSENVDLLKVILCDLLNDGQLSAAEVQNRKIHSSQFLYNFWCVFKKKHLSILYCDKSGDKSFYSSVDGDVCQNIQDGKVEFSYLAQKVEFKNL